DFVFEMPRKVAPGAVVRITNKDVELHTFTSERAGLDVQVPVGKTVQFRAPSKAGTYRVVCTLHADMDTTLVVG
ncbi:MAG: cupredoxin domain-containing protein, partial [Actinomycetota bacterium]|nr:cupredoxin domain-containing protein [Actinomycetota bacterium]